MSVNKKFGPHVRQWRTSAGLTQEQVAIRLEEIGDKISQQSYGYIESRGMAYNPGRFRSLDQVFNLTPGTAQATWVRTAEEEDEPEGGWREAYERLEAEVAELRRMVTGAGDALPPAAATPAPSRTERSRRRPPT